MVLTSGLKVFHSLLGQSIFFSCLAFELQIVFLLGLIMASLAPSTQGHCANTSLKNGKTMAYLELALRPCEKCFMVQVHVKYPRTLNNGFRSFWNPDSIAVKNAKKNMQDATRVTANGTKGWKIPTVNLCGSKRNGNLAFKMTSHRCGGTMPAAGILKYDED